MICYEQWHIYKLLMFSHLTYYVTEFPSQSPGEDRDASDPRVSKLRGFEFLVMDVPFRYGANSDFVKWRKEEWDIITPPARGIMGISGPEGVLMLPKGR